MSILEEVNSIVNSRMNDDHKLEKFGQLYDGGITSAMMGADIETDFIKKKRQSFIAEMGDFIKTSGIDWEKGMPHLFRGGLARADTLEEREKYLTDAVGKDGWYRQGEEFVVKKDKLGNFNMQSDRDIGIDPEGLDWGDVNPLGDAAGVALPIASTVATGLRATGLGTVPAMALMGLAGAGGKAIDESIEYVRGKNLQTGGQVAGDIGKEAAFAAGGEGIFRVASAGVRYAMGPGRKMMVQDQATGESVKGSMFGRRGKAIIVEEKEHQEIIEKLIEKGYSLDADQILPNSYPGFYTKLQKLSSWLFGDPKARNYKMTERVLNKLGYGGALKKEPMKDLHNVATQIRHLVDAKQTASSAAFGEGKKELENSLVTSVDDILKELGGDDIISGSGNYYQDALIAAHANGKELSKAYYQRIDDILVKNGIKDNKVVSFQSLEDKITSLLASSGRSVGSSPYRMMNGRTKDLIESVMGKQGLDAQGEAIWKSADRSTFADAHSIRSDMIGESYNPELAFRTEEQGLLMKVSDIVTDHLENLKPMGARFLQGGGRDPAIKAAGLKELGTAFNSARDFYRGFSGEFKFHKLAKLLTNSDDAAKHSDQIGRMLMHTKDAELAAHAKQILSGRFGSRIGSQTYPKGSYKPEFKEVGSFETVRKAYTKEMFTRLASTTVPDGIKPQALLNELKGMRFAGTANQNVLDVIYGKSMGNQLMSFAKQMEGMNAKVGNDLVDRLDVILSQSGRSSNWEGKFTKALVNYKNLAKEDHLIQNSIFIKEFMKPEWAKANGASMVKTLWKEDNETLAHQAMEAIRKSDHPVHVNLVSEVREMGARQFLVDNMLVGSQDAVTGLSGSKILQAASKYSDKHLEALLGKDHLDAIMEFGKTLKILESSEMSFSSIATSTLPIHPLNNKGLFFKLAFVGNLLNSPTMMRWISKGLMSNDHRAVAEAVARLGQISAGQGVMEGFEKESEFAESQLQGIGQ
jgi:hypothetical protein